MTFTEYPSFKVTRLAPGTADGAVDSTKSTLKAKPRAGKALKTGVPMTPSQNPKLRKRKRR
jgi:hypothetical protein